MERTPKENRFEFVAVASKRARQLLKGATPRETGEKKVTIAQREVLRRKVEKIKDADSKIPSPQPQIPAESQ
jgi:DNA-directed RNA polymerase omega subunit